MLSPSWSRRALVSSSRPVRMSVTRWWFCSAASESFAMQGPHTRIQLASVHDTMKPYGASK